MSTTTAKKKPEPGPKPEYLVVGDHLYCQTDEGEKAIDLRVPLKTLESFMDMEGLEPKAMPRYILDHILADDDKTTLETMKDGVKAFAILMRFANALGERLGASLGESKGSDDSSENTEEPSDTTSGTPSD